VFRPEREDPINESHRHVRREEGISEEGASDWKKKKETFDPSGTLPRGGDLREEAPNESERATMLW